MTASPALTIDRVGPGGSGGGVPVLFVFGLPGTNGPVAVLIDADTNRDGNAPQGAIQGAIQGTVRTLWPVRGLPARLPERLAAGIRIAAREDAPWADGQCP